MRSMGEMVGPWAMASVWLNARLTLFRMLGIVSLSMTPVQGGGGGISSAKHVQANSSGISQPHNQGKIYIPEHVFFKELLR